MSVGERVTDLVANPVVGTAKGAVTGAAIGGATGGTLGGLVGAVAGGLTSMVYLAGPAGLVASVLGGLIFGHFLLIGLATAAAVTVAGAAVGAAVGGLGVGSIGAWAGLQTGGVFGFLAGTYKGIKAFFTGRDNTMDNEQQLRALREQAMIEQARTAAYLRQQERAAAMSNVNNPDASDNNVNKLQAKQQQAASTPTPPMPV